MTLLIYLNYGNLLFLTRHVGFFVSVIYGTHHVLVLAGFSPNTRTTDLEKALDKFKDRFVIRWVNDTTALAVFGTPSAGNDIHAP